MGLSIRPEIFWEKFSGRSYLIKEVAGRDKLTLGARVPSLLVLTGLVPRLDRRFRQRRDRPCGSTLLALRFCAWLLVSVYFVGVYDLECLLALPEYLYSGD